MILLAVLGIFIQNKQHFIREVTEGIEDDYGAALIKLDQSKAFNRVDHRFLAAVLETAGFKLEFCRRIGILYQSPTPMVEVNGMRSGFFAIEWSVRQGFPSCPNLTMSSL